ALAFAAAGPAPGRRPLRTEGALQRLARTADGRAALRRRRRDRRAGGAARTGEVAAAARPVELRPLMPAGETTHDAPLRAERERIALVLGAGGARGLAQIGVIEVLEERGF